MNHLVKVAIVALALVQLSACSLTPEQRTNMARAMSESARNYHPYMLPPVQPAKQPTTTTTNCASYSPGQVTCSSTSY